MTAITIIKKMIQRDQQVISSLGNVSDDPNDLVSLISKSAQMRVVDLESVLNELQRG